MIRFWKVCVLLVTCAVPLLLLALGPALAGAPPPLPSSFYGTVKVGGRNVPTDTLVTAWIGGMAYQTATVSIFQSATVYSLDVPGDVSGTPGKEGGVEGETIVFHIGSQVVPGTQVWKSGANENADLDIITTYIPRAVASR